jgi:hypothetical protein
MKKLVNIFSIGSLLCIISYLTPWIVAPNNTSFSGYNISEVLKYFNDGSDFVLIFSLTHIVFAGSLLILILQFIDKGNTARWIGLAISIIGFISFFIIKLGLSGKTFELGYKLGLAGLLIYFLQTFIGFFRKPLLK